VILVHRLASQVVGARPERERFRVSAQMNKKMTFSFIEVVCTFNERNKKRRLTNGIRTHPAE
jgi:hypothetical protein